MKKTVSFLMLGLFATSVAWADPNLFSRFSGKPVKVYVAPAEDSTSTHDIDTAVLKTKLEEALKGRKSIRFQIVENAADADLTIESQVVGYVWTDHDPVDMLVGIGGAAADAALVEDFASTEVDMKVTDTKSKIVVWRDRIRASVTKKQMSRPDSVPLVSDQLAKTFIKECFSKRSNRK